jgi:hypothetical protein
MCGIATIVDADDPLRTAFGAGEGRARTNARGGVDPDRPGPSTASNRSYYLRPQSPRRRPAVASIPIQHFQIFGWREGRDPNALFDTAGYIAAYQDVAAAGVNPLDHYNAFGWHEGRDPSVGFRHRVLSGGLSGRRDGWRQPARALLAFGVHEGRSPFADGIWG